jgi:hypothetical protein
MNKNIHIIPTNKLSRLVQRRMTKEIKTSLLDNPQLWNNINIYITNDEEIKGEWFYNPFINEIQINCNSDGCKKIIITDNKDLIKDGVQAIDDTFLEWFVKNLSCERVEVKNYKSSEYPLNYKIIIPQEEYKPLPDVNWESDIINKVWDEDEPKQETIEEAAKIWVNNRFTKQICGNESYSDIHASKEGIVESHILFAKIQTQKMFNDEEVKYIIGEALQSALVTVDLEQWFEQFKKK